MQYVNLFTEEGLTNNPLPGLHSKYLTPSKLPSFLPVSSSSSTPIQVPGYKNQSKKHTWQYVSPIYRTVPILIGLPFTSTDTLSPILTKTGIIKEKKR